MRAFLASMIDVRAHDAVDVHGDARDEPLRNCLLLEDRGLGLFRARLSESSHLDTAVTATRQQTARLPDTIRRRPGRSLTRDQLRPTKARLTRAHSFVAGARSIVV